MARHWLGVLILLCVPALAGAAPRLTLFIAVDAMGSDLLLRHRTQLKGGLGTLMTQGAFFPTVRYGHAEPATAAGHATLVTGAHPWRHGVVGNSRWNQATGKLDPIFADPDYPVLEVPPGNENASPVNLVAETLADRLRLATSGRGKAIALAEKSRSAIALGGKLGQAWWFHPTVGKLVTGTFYTKAFPGWVKTFNERQPADKAFGSKWSLARPAAAYTGDDDRPYEADAFGLGRTFPHPVTGGLERPGPEFYKALASTPLMNDLLVDAARAALEAEGLGRDPNPDLLLVSFSPIDRIYHLYGPNSWEMQDAMVRLDRSIGRLIAVAEKAAGGRKNLLVILSSDHGGAAIPEEWAAQGLPAVRVDAVRLAQELSAALKERFGAADLVLGLEDTDVYLNDRAIASRKLDGAQVRRAAAEWLGRHPSIALAVPRDGLFGVADGPHAGFRDALQKGYFPGRSGDVFLIAEQHHVVTDEPTGTNHGMPYGYDSVVPLVLWGAGVRPGLYAQEIQAVDVAPTVSALLRMAPPAMSEGVPRSEALNVR